MIVKFEDEELDFSLDEITVSQATTLKRKLGLTLIGLDAGLSDGDPDALRAVYWLMQTQAGKRVDIDSVDFKIVKFANAIQAAVEVEAAKDAAEKEDAPKD